MLMKIWLAIFILFMSNEIVLVLIFFARPRF